MVELRQADFEAFFQAPFEAYGPDSKYVSPMKGDLWRTLSRDQNPLFAGDSELTYFTAHDGGRVLGRITAHVHAESNCKFDTNNAYFGFFDCADHSLASHALLGAAESWARQRGYDTIAGNFNLTAMQQLGVMTEGFESAPYTDQIYSPPHIHKLLEAEGYKRHFPMTTFETAIAANSGPSGMGAQENAIAADPDYSLAPISYRTIDARLEDARHILNASFADNPHFVPLTSEEFHFQSKDMKWIMDPRISAIMHYKGEPVACIICIPDLNPITEVGGAHGWGSVSRFSSW